MRNYLWEMQKPGQFFGYMCFNVKRYRNLISDIEITLSSLHLPNKQIIALQYLKSACLMAEILFRSRYSFYNSHLYC